MPFRPALTREELAKIRARYAPTPERAPCNYQDAVVWADVVTLLYEIKRLRAMLLKAEQLRDRFPRPDNALNPLWERFVRELSEEPCVIEQVQLKSELLSPLGKLEG
ncbi:hypothetical protein CAL26_05230 [Bordetella genomosp. 9]|uniref:Uncharacterized protein n=1 Tax=Bordetella genomosp. 9 TaxID=1416803 RepID=A0A261RNV5_9BORD|nr:hypothetical protein CAL26_05230 [Bordetella genomosp. 9]